MTLDTIQYYAILALKEQARQLRRVIREVGEEAFSAMLENDPRLKRMFDLLLGRISSEQAEAANLLDEEAIDTLVRSQGDPAQITAVDAKNEARAKNLPVPAQLLATDAVRCAGAGMTKEQWIAEVLNGHANDDEAQIGCLQLIAEIWKNGPWPWTRGTTWKEQAASATP